MIAIVAAVVFSAGALWTLLQTKMYRGAATVLLEDQKGSQLDVLEGLSSFGGPIPVETEMEILKSRTIAEEVVRELSLDATLLDPRPGVKLRLLNYRSDLYPPENMPDFEIQVSGHYYLAFDEDGSELGKGVLGKPFVVNGLTWTLDATAPSDVKSLRFRKVPFSKAVEALQKNTIVKEVGKKTNVISVTVDAPDPFVARDIANKLASTYLAYNIARKSQVATQTLDFIGQQLDTIRGNLEIGEQELGTYKSQMGIFLLSDSAKNIIDQIARLETVRAELEIQSHGVASLMRALDSAGGQDGPYILGQVSLPDPVVGTLVAELSKSLVDLRGLSQELSDDNPKIMLAKSQVNELREKVRLAVKNAGKSLSSRLSSVNGLIKSYEGRLRRLPENERQLATLTRKSEVNAELYTFLLKRHEEARITRASIVGNVKVLDSALVPDKPESPKLKRNLVVFLVLGIFFGLIFAFVLEFADDTIKSVEEIDKYLGLGLFGVIPHVDNHNDSVIITKIDPREFVQEAFRTLRTNLQFTDSEHTIKSIVAASALPGVGKSTVIANLGVTLAQGGERVLLVDCDLRRPQIHRFFDIPSEPGLTNGLLSENDWRSFVHSRTGVENLSVLPAGVLPPNPAEFLGSNHFRSFKSEAEQEFDYVLFDVPPIVAFTDAALVAARADAVFFILELGRTQLPLSRRALELLANVQAKVRGVIVNKAGKLGANAQGYYAYGYHGYYEDRPNATVSIAKRLWDKVRKV